MSSLVLGAGGFLGLNLVDALRASGRPFVCGSRRAAPRVALRRRGVRCVRADLDDPESLVGAMAGVSTVYHLAGHYPAVSLDPDGTLMRGTRQLNAVLDAAAQAGVERLVYVSSTATVAPSPTGVSSEADVLSSAPDGVYHRVKWAMEQRVLNERRFEVRVACPGACLGPWDQRIGTSAPLVALANGHAPRLPDGIVNLVDVRDVAAACVALGVRNQTPTRVLLVGHDRRLSDFMAALARRYGVSAPILLSRAEAEALADAEERRSVVSGGRPRLSRELVDLVVSAVPIDARLSREALSLAYRPLEDTLCAFETWARKRRIIPRTPEVAR